MTARADLLKEDFQHSVGLDRVFGKSLYHVSGLTGWTPSNTAQVVYTVVPYSVGQAHSDPSLSRAICTSVRLIEGPLVQTDGTYEAIVAVTFDSDRRWGAAFQEGTTEYGIDQDVLVPTWSKQQVIAAVPGAPAVYNFIESTFPYRRSKIIRLEPRDATNISEDQRAVVFSYVGRPFKIFGITYIMRSPRITRSRTNQTILTYVFESSSPIPAHQAGTPPGSDVAIPFLDFLEEYTRVYSDPPTVGKKSATSLGTPGDPTLIPFWEARLV